MDNTFVYIISSSDFKHILAYFNYITMNLIEQY